MPVDRNPASQAGNPGRPDDRSDPRPESSEPSLAEGGQKPPANDRNETNVKETIESILVAFILAFIFRAFVVEAFVIPTGSMAPTLMGAHMRYRCDDCGYRWDVNFSTGSSDDINIPASGVWRGRNPNLPPAPIHCPNCGYPVRVTNDRDPDNRLESPPVHYGDRILVLKYLYLFEKPQRWDVVVFKSPAEPPRARRNELEPLFSQNYIKRLVGNPGESIVILDGDVYVCTDPLPHREDGSLDFDHVDWTKFHIQRKPWVVQEALWRNVYDNDFIPHLPDEKRALTRDEVAALDIASDRAGQPWRQPWTERSAGSGWDVAKNPHNREFHFDGLSNSAGGALDFDPAANPDTWALTDHLAYDELDEQDLSRHWRRNPVGDLRLSLYYTRHAGDGPLELSLTKAGRTFTAVVSRGRVTLRESYRGSPPRDVAPGVDVKDLRSNEPVRLEFCNVDYRVFLRVNGHEVLATTDEQYHPDVADLVRRREQEQPMPAVGIAAAGQRCTVEHLTLSRDIYYLNRHSWSGSTLWGDPDKPIELGADEYFVLGDNSFISGDARTWIEPNYPQPLVNLPGEDLVVANGRVPGRFMLGKAFFVYWPAGYRPWQAAPGLVPNFGDMRFIH